jgi:hypothetical protein
MANTQVNITENGTTTLATSGKYCDRNVDVVVNVAGGGDDIPEEAFTITGDCSYRFSYGGWSWFIEKYGDRVTTKDITNAQYMFSGSNKLKSIPFTINLNGNSCVMSRAFSSCNYLEEVPSVTFPDTVTQFELMDILTDCWRVRSADSLFDAENISNCTQKIAIKGKYEQSFSEFFYCCYSLRKVPEWYKAFKFNREESTTYLATYRLPWYCTFIHCCSLDEITGIPVLAFQKAELTDNGFSNFATYCCRLKALVFATQEDGTPYTVNWTAQVINLSEYTGFGTQKERILNYNSGITSDKEVTDDTTYQALKDDPDWFTLNVNYSRYNHDSAVETINSLPDTSAYLATAGGTNTIKFTGAAGAKTDGGAINTLTEEEIAVATAKGWTVTLV